MSETGLVTDARYEEHDTGAGHPESPERCRAILSALETAGLRAQLRSIVPREASDEELLLCHGARYLELAQRDLDRGEFQLSTGDTPLSPRTLTVARLAAGGAFAAVDAVISDRVRAVFCPVRPPGHHAEAERGMGFCVFNNVALAARYAQRKHGLARVAIVDWDVHHGNGTQAIFWDDASVFFFSTHQAYWYPGTGAADEVGAGTIINRPLAAGAGRAEVLGAFEDDLVPALDVFKPQLLLISAGFDSRRDDPFGGFLLTDEDFADLTRVVLAIAERHAEGRVVSLLEGGYNLHGLGQAAAAHVGALLEA